MVRLHPGFQLGVSLVIGLSVSLDPAGDIVGGLFDHCGKATTRVTLAVKKSFYLLGFNPHKLTNVYWKVKCATAKCEGF